MWGPSWGRTGARVFCPMSLLSPLSTLVEGRGEGLLRLFRFQKLQTRMHPIPLALPTRWTAWKIRKGDGEIRQPRSASCRIVPRPSQGWVGRDTGQALRELALFYSMFLPKDTGQVTATGPAQPSTTPAPRARPSPEHPFPPPRALSCPRGPFPAPECTLSHSPPLGLSLASARHSHECCLAVGEPLRTGCLGTRCAHWPYTGLRELWGFGQQSAVFQGGGRREMGQPLGGAVYGGFLL